MINAKDIALHADELKLQFDRDGFAFIQSLISRDYAQKIADTVFDVERQLLESPDETEHIFEKDDQIIYSFNNQTVHNINLVHS